jgi:hypothetical protein
MQLMRTCINARCNYGTSRHLVNRVPGLVARVSTIALQRGDWKLTGYPQLPDAGLGAAAPGL